MQCNLYRSMRRYATDVFGGPYQAPKLDIFMKTSVLCIGMYCYSRYPTWHTTVPAGRKSRKASPSSLFKPKMLLPYDNKMQSVNTNIGSSHCIYSTRPEVDNFVRS